MTACVYDKMMKQWTTTYPWIQNLSELPNNRPFAKNRGHLEMETNSCILKRYFFVFDFKEKEDVDQLFRYFTQVSTDAWRCHLHC